MHNAYIHVCIYMSNYQWHNAAAGNGESLHKIQQESKATLCASLKPHCEHLVSCPCCLYPAWVHLSQKPFFVSLCIEVYVNMHLDDELYSRIHIHQCLLVGMHVCTMYMCVCFWGDTYVRIQYVHTYMCGTYQTLTVWGWTIVPVWWIVSVLSSVHSVPELWVHRSFRVVCQQIPIKQHGLKELHTIRLSL